jgi:galactose mutarotase-like enzyme
MERINYLGEELCRWKVGASTFLAWPEHGARLMNWNLQLADGSIRDVLYWPETTDLNDFKNIRGGNPILFPFNARTFDKGDIHFWRAEDKIRRPMPMHGFAREGKFEVINIDEHGFSAILIPDEAAKEAYPFEYEFTVNYQFRPLGVSVEFQLKNLGTVPLPWSAGHHFYFTLPWHDEMTRNDYSIHLPAKKAFRQDTKGQLVPVEKFKTEESFASPQLSDQIHTDLKSNKIIFGEKNGGDQITMRVGTDPVPEDGTTIVTWTESKTAPFYCVEPWMGPPNSPEHDIGLHYIPPKKKGTFAVEIRLN